MKHKLNYITLKIMDYYDDVKKGRIFPIIFYGLVGVGLMDASFRCVKLADVTGSNTTYIGTQMFLAIATVGLGLGGAIVFIAALERFYKNHVR